LASYQDLTYDDIVNIHDDVQAQFSTRIERGIQNKGLLKSIVKRPSQKHYNHEHFADIYSKCASLMEAIIQWHPFVDGNKRTALVAAQTYMNKNNYVLVTPYSSIRFTVLIAQKKKDHEDIREWVQTHSTHRNNSDEYATKIKKYIIEPTEVILSLYRSEEPAKIKQARTLMNEWLAIDIYPEYKMEEKETIQFLIDRMNKYSHPPPPPPPPP
jgi:death on curing protein